MKRTEYAAQDFAWTQWTGEEIGQAAQEMLKSKWETYAAIKAIQAGERTFENTVYALEASNHILWKLHAINLLMNVSPSQDIRDTAQRWVDQVEKELVDIEYDEDMYQAVKEYEAKKEALDGPSEKLFSDMLREYRRMGFKLPKEKREELKKNLKRINELSSEFSKNINEHHDAIIVTRAELDGLSDGYIASLKQDGDNYLVSLDYPELNPFMENATNAAKRKELMEKALHKGGSRNMEILKEVVRMRDENARILGYEHHADFRLEVKMAKDAKTVFGFMSELMGKMRGGLEKEMNELKALKHRIAPDEGEEVRFYDIAFLSSELKKERLNIDTQKVAEYFPLQKVLQGMLEVYAHLLSVKFEEVAGYPVWHEDVKVYAVRELSGDIIAYFFLDLYPREGKYGHAAVFEVITGYRKGFSGDEYTVPVASMLANFPKPSAQHPSLMTHYEAVVLFHEFGHVMHETLTKARYRSQAGFNVAWDFAEAPSQMLENWMWDKEVLAKISGHYKTGEKLPEAMLESLAAAKTFMVAYSTMRQMVMASFDMELHTRGIEGELNEEYAQMVAQTMGILLPQEQIFLAGWGHLMGYDAGYYGYMWSLVYAADMFTRFEKEGVLNAKTGMEYRKWILEKGSSQDEMSLVEGFLGRTASNDAFLRSKGL
ncbi:MAG: Zn-dependent oligopeptidase [Candidatus Moranbacteria bacterium]|nr:Zn-dependent oligopeptidase [Candidatus Moranbacteria bacterium]